MKSYISILAISIALSLAFSSCKKDDPPANPSPTYGDLAIRLEHVWGMNAVPIDINQKIFHPKTQDTVTLTTFKYYISNIQVKKAGGSWYALDSSYHLIDLADPASLFITFKGLETGNYDEVKFMMGVDSLRNTGGDQIADLDPANGMFWDFNQGYIMIKAEGNSPSSPTGKFKYHLGGFTGPYKNILQKHQLLTSTPIMVNASKTVSIFIEANPAKLWHHYGSISNGHEIVTVGPDAHEMGFDFQDALRIVQVVN